MRRRDEHVYEGTTVESNRSTFVNALDTQPPSYLRREKEVRRERGKKGVLGWPAGVGVSVGWGVSRFWVLGVFLDSRLRRNDGRCGLWAAQVMGNHKGCPYTGMCSAFFRAWGKAASWGRGRGGSWVVWFPYRGTGHV